MLIAVGRRCRRSGSAFGRQVWTFFPDSKLDQSPFESVRPPTPINRTSHLIAVGSSAGQAAGRCGSLDSRWERRVESIVLKLFLAADIFAAAAAASVPSAARCRTLRACLNVIDRILLRTFFRSRLLSNVCFKHHLCVSMKQQEHYDTD